MKTITVEGLQKHYRNSYQEVAENEYVKKLEISFDQIDAKRKTHALSAELWQTKHKSMVDKVSRQVEKIKAMKLLIRQFEAIILTSQKPMIFHELNNVNVDSVNTKNEELENAGQANYHNP